MTRLRIVVWGLLLIVATMYFAAAPSRATTSGAGAARIDAVSYGPVGPYPFTSSLTIRGIDLTGGFLDAPSVAIARVHIGTFTGIASYCPSLGCGTYILSANLTSTGVPLQGVAVSGMSIMGSCNGGYLDVGGSPVSNTVLSTSCSVRGGNGSLGAFQLVVNTINSQNPTAVPPSSTGSDAGLFCTDSAFNVCAQSLGISNPVPT
jgi:hypothetical protein